jgi:hypothetical protein
VLLDPCERLALDHRDARSDAQSGSERLCVAGAALLGHNRRRKLFCTLDGRTLKQSYVRHLLWRLADKAGR